MGDQLVFLPPRIWRSLHCCGYRRWNRCPATAVNTSPRSVGHAAYFNIVRTVMRSRPVFAQSCFIFDGFGGLSIASEACAAPSPCSSCRDVASRVVLESSIEPGPMVSDDVARLGRIVTSKWSVDTPQRWQGHVAMCSVFRSCRLEGFTVRCGRMGKPAMMMSAPQYMIPTLSDAGIYTSRPPVVER